MQFRRIEDLWVGHDLTQQQVADIWGCQREVYRRCGKGTRTIPVELHIQLADYDKVSLDYPVGRKKQRNGSSALWTVEPFRFAF